MNLNFNFAAFLLLVTLLSGAIWAVDLLVFKPKRKKATVEANGKSTGSEKITVRSPVVVEYARSFFPVFLAVLLLRSFVIEPFHIPSASMEPTIITGDFILVNKFKYGLRLPVFNTKILSIGEPKRGDVAVFRFPENPDIDFIKRVIGVPGDRIVYKDKILYVNGKEMSQDPLGLYAGPGIPGARVDVEHLDTVTHRILTIPDLHGREGEWVVPPDEYFVMGDNRDNSNDSRYWGFVPEKNLVGKAFLIWMNWGFPDASPIWNRIGDTIK